MFFKVKRNKWYSKYWESEDGEIGIGLEEMLFSRIRVVVLHKDGGQYPEWVIEQYPTYKRELIYPLIIKIMDNLKEVNITSGKEWWKVYEALPEKVKKYLEDSQIDRDFVERRQHILKNIKRHYEKEN